MFSDIMFDVNVRYEMKNILMMVGMCLTILFGYNMTNPVTEANTHAIREVKVQAGDTMWDIAARTAHKDMDVREMVLCYEGTQQKLMTLGALVPGTVLKVPVKKMIVLLELWTMWLKTKYIWV